MNQSVKTLALITLTSLSALLITGCETASQGSKTYTRGQAQQSMEIQRGTVMRVAQVQIQPEKTGAGAAVGGVAGGVVGSTIGQGKGSTLASVGGALAGAAIGSKSEQKMRTKPALEIEVKLDSGRTLVIVQEADDIFHVGDHVRIITDNKGVSRVRQ